METKINFSNQLIDTASLPKIEQIEYTRVSTKYLRIMMFNRVLTFSILAIGFLILNYYTVDNFQYLSTFFLIWTLLFSLVLVYGYFHFFSLAFAVREKDIVFKRGVLVLKTTIIPFNRIQHVALNQGLLMRWMGLSNLKIFTAGGSTSDLIISGLKSEIAESVKIHITTAVSEEKSFVSDDDFPVNATNMNDLEINYPKETLNSEDTFDHNKHNNELS